MGGQYQELKKDAVKLDEYENKWLERLERYEKKQEEHQAEQKKKLGNLYVSPEERKAWQKANAGKTAEDFLKEFEKEAKDKAKATS